MKVVQQDVEQNVAQINKILTSMGFLSAELGNLTREVQGTQLALKVYMQVDRLMYQISSAMNLARDYNNQIRLQLSTLTLGHLSPIVIAPSTLFEALTNIKSQLDEDLLFDLPYDPYNNLWQYYKTLSCVAFVGDYRLVVITAIPLLDRRDRFHLYEVLNLAMPKMGINNTKVVSKYDLEGSALVIDTRKTRFAVLKGVEADRCISSPELCQFNGPLYTVESADNCVISVFLDNKAAIYRTCTARVFLQTQLPAAQYITDGNWFVITDIRLTFTIVCDNGRSGQSESVTVEAPVGIVGLNESCSAHNGKMSLPAHHTVESTIEWTNPLQQLIQNYHIGKTSWEKLDFELPNVTLVEIPEKLRTHKQLPLQDLIDEIGRDPTLVDMETRTPIWHYVLYGIGILCAIGLLLYLFRRRVLRLVYRLRMLSRSAETRADGIHSTVRSEVTSTSVDGTGSNDSWRTRRHGRVGVPKRAEHEEGEALDEAEWAMIAKVYEAACDNGTLAPNRRMGNQVRDRTRDETAINMDEERYGLKEGRLTRPDVHQPVQTNQPSKCGKSDSNSGAGEHPQRIRSDTEEGLVCADNRRKLYPSLTKELGMSC